MLGTSKETRSNVSELHQFLVDRFDPNQTDVVIVSQAYHDANRRLERLSTNILGEFDTNSRFLSVEDVEAQYPVRFSFAPEVRRTPTIAE